MVEGSLQEIKIVGNRRLNNGYIRSRILLGAGKPLNVPRLLEKLQLLRLDPLIQNLSAELQTGVRPGSNVLRVEVKEANTFTVTTTLDNGRSPSVGSFRRGVNLQEANLLGLGDTLSVGYVNTDGSNTVNANYTLPINAHNGTVWFGFNQGWNHVIEEPFSVLDIQSNTTSYELGYRQPLLQKPNQDLAIGLSFSRQQSQTALGIDNIGPFRLSPGADENGKTNISALRFFQEYTQRSNQYVFAMRSQFSIGVDWFGANVSEDAPDSRFFAWRGQAQWVRQLAPDTLFLARGDLQLAANSLLPLEQFGVGGQLSVRGYRQDTLLTDNGMFFSAEFRLPIVRAPNQGGVLQLTPFGTTNTIVNPNGNNFTILNGIEKGNNLFHSFSNFSVPNGGSASFDLINTPNIRTIFSRVTGGKVSDINGLLQTLNGNYPVSLFLMNPAGIMFGKNAALNIGGSFVGTTANSIKFSDGTEFSAVNTATPPLLTMSVPIGLQLGLFRT
nr:filamentous hemagglutinin N-terminal domain-containing protein [Gloeotrichia echinulata DEX184]